MARDERLLNELSEDERKRFERIQDENYRVFDVAQRSTLQDLVRVLAFVCPGATAATLAFIAATSNEALSKGLWSPVLIFAAATFLLLTALVLHAWREGDRARRLTLKLNELGAYEITMADYYDFLDRKVNPNPLLFRLEILGGVIPIMFMISGSVWAAIVILASIAEPSLHNGG